MKVNCVNSANEFEEQYKGLGIPDCFHRGCINTRITGDQNDCTFRQQSSS